MEKRKNDHIELALQSRVSLNELDERFNYEPMLSGHSAGYPRSFSFLGKILRTPVWISSMTGGSERAYAINRNLAMVCREFGMGMGLGSCRALLDGNEHFEDFNMRPLIGDDLPFYANLGISQVEYLVGNNRVHVAVEMVKKLQADGLIVHVNPMQEFFQPEGDRLLHPPVETIEKLLSRTQLKVIVKEVGQGMGPESLLALLRMPIEAIEFGAFGGTNFARLEWLRSGKTGMSFLEPLIKTGHSADEMVDIINQYLDAGTSFQCKQIIVSGGIRSFLDGYYLMRKIKMPAIYGQASAFLSFAGKSFEELHRFVEAQVKGLQMAYSFLTVK